MLIRYERYMSVDLNDEDYILRGGTERDIEESANRNGADLNKTDVELHEARELLKTAVCPDIFCDNQGTTAQRMTDNEWHRIQCYWCFQRAKLLGGYPHEL